MALTGRGKAEARQLAVNRRRWDELVSIHANSRFYDLEGFRRGAVHLHSIEREELGPVRGKRLLHLQCHFGLDTLSWARLGAKVTGVDYSAEAIDFARRLARETRIRARFVESDIYGLPQVLRGRYDIVFTSYGALSWLPDIGRWAHVAVGFLKPGGTLYLVEGHPFSGVFNDEKPSPPLHVLRPYFPGKRPFRFVTPGDYADFSAKVRNLVTYEWGHPLGEIISAVAGAGLHIQALHEFPFAGWRMFPFMRKGKDGWWHLPAGLPNLPLMFSLKAMKPRRSATRSSRVPAKR